MKRIAKQALVAASIAAVTLQSVPTASACGGSGRRYAPVYGGYARAASNYRSTLPVTPPLTYSNPTYHQPVMPQPAQPIAQPLSPAAVQPQPRAQVAAKTAASVAAQTTAVTRQAPATTSSPTTGNDVESSALAALASITSQGTAPSQGSTNPQPAVSSQPAVNVNSNPNAAPATVPTFTATHVGNFQATLQSNVTVQLELSQSGTFSWIVRGQGKTTSFSGQYRVSDGKLTLVRSNDLQQMTGKLTTIENGFTFKLDGTGNTGLNFKRV